jgi:DNA-binding transcriptional ArsR family regulator
VGTEACRGYGRSMSVAYQSDIAPVAALFADPSRAAMLRALLNVGALTAGELARAAGVSPATASEHLARLLDGGLVVVRRQGRHRYYEISGPPVAAALESLSLISHDVPPRTLRQSSEARALAQGRTCYDHLAGRDGVELLDALLRSGTLVSVGDEDYEVSEPGSMLLTDWGIDVGQARASRRRFAGACLDWTQRRSHLNGALGAAITTRLFELGWIARGSRQRSVNVTKTGKSGLSQTFGWRPAD